MSKYRHENSPIYIPGTDIPKNKLGIDDAELLHEIEANLLKDAYRLFHDELNENTVFDELYFKSLHRCTFGALYEWAGEYRTVNMSKAGSRFCLADYLQAESKRVFAGLAGDDYLKQCAEWQKERFAEKLAYYACELVALHPFYELNGRITRLFFDMIAAFNGYEFIDYTEAAASESQSDNAYIKASIDCVQFADSKAMGAILFKGLVKIQDEESQS